MGNDFYVDMNPQALRELAAFPDDLPLYTVIFLKYVIRKQALIHSRIICCK